MTRWKSGTRVSARRPWPGPWSRMIVPVSAIATAHPVTTPAIWSSSAAGSGGVSRGQLDGPGAVRSAIRAAARLARRRDRAPRRRVRPGPWRWPRGGRARGPARRRLGSRRPARRTGPRCHRRRGRGGRAGTRETGSRTPRRRRHRRAPGGRPGRRRRSRPQWRRPRPSSRHRRPGRWRRGCWPGSLSLELVMIAGLWSWPTRRGTTPVAGPGRRGFRSSRSVAAAAA